MSCAKGLLPLPPGMRFICSPTCTVESQRIGMIENGGQTAQEQIIHVVLVAQHASTD
jgi:hypothetical protein